MCHTSARKEGAAKSTLWIVTQGNARHVPFALNHGAVSPARLPSACSQYTPLSPTTGAKSLTTSAGIATCLAHGLCHAPTKRVKRETARGVVSRERGERGVIVLQYADSLCMERCTTPSYVCMGAHLGSSAVFSPCQMSACGIVYFALFIAKM